MLIVPATLSEGVLSHTNNLLGGSPLMLIVPATLLEGVLSHTNSRSYCVSRVSSLMLTVLATVFEGEPASC